MRLVCCMCSSFKTISDAVHMQRYGRVSRDLVRLPNAILFPAGRQGLPVHAKHVSVG